MNCIKKHLHRICAALTACLLLTACTSGAPLYTADSSGASAETQSYKKYPLRAHEKDSGENGEGYGMLTFTHESDEAKKLTEIDRTALPVEDGSLKMYLNVLAYTPKPLTATFFLFWNGEVYDFTLDGKQSTDGMITMEVKDDKDYVIPFEVNDLPVQEGNNTFYFSSVFYGEKTGKYPVPQRYEGHFQSEEARSGRAPLRAASESELAPGQISTKTERADAIQYRTVNSEAVISSKWQNYQLHPNPIFYLNASNIRNQDDPCNRSGIMLIFIDGKPQACFDGCMYGKISLTDKEYRKEFAFPTSFQAGEKHAVLLLYSETEVDKVDSSMLYATFHYFYILNCTIKD